MEILQPRRNHGLKENFRKFLIRNSVDDALHQDDLDLATKDSLGFSNLMPGSFSDYDLTRGLRHAVLRGTDHPSAGM